MTPLTYPSARSSSQLSKHGRCLPLSQHASASREASQTVCRTPAKASADSTPPFGFDRYSLLAARVPLYQDDYLSAVPALGKVQLPRLSPALFARLPVFGSIALLSSRVSIPYTPPCILISWQSYTQSLYTPPHTPTLPSIPIQTRIRPFTTADTPVQRALGFAAALRSFGLIELVLSHQ